MSARGEGDADVGVSLGKCLDACKIRGGIRGLREEMSGGGRGADDPDNKGQLPHTLALNQATSALNSLSSSLNPKPQTLDVFDTWPQFSTHFS
jgi:hypothetical protein